MGIEDFIDDDDESSTDSTTTENEESTSDEDTNRYDEYADLDEELDPEVAAIVDEVVEEWNKDQMIEFTLHGEEFTGRRADLVYGIVNIVKRTQHHFDNKD